jgi:hypothetical protein
MWTVKFVGVTEIEKIMKMLMTKFTFLTLATGTSEKGEIMQSYFIKNNTFKKIDKKCCVCLTHKTLRLNLCCGSTVCRDCEVNIKKEQCNFYDYSWESMKAKA